jgi:hypothetical protein
VLLRLYCIQLNNKAKRAYYMYVFFNAEDAKVKITVDNEFVAYASNAEELLEAMNEFGVDASATMMASSDVDFASEEGFATDSCAHDIIEEALALL